jgi:hypothetical protein
MGWIWNSHKKPQAKSKLNFDAKNRRKNQISGKLRVTLELDMDYPGSSDIAQAIRDTKLSFELPTGIEIRDAHLARVEILNEK